jgi:C1A family cysteine protease
MAHSTSNASGNTKGFNRTPDGGGNRGMASAYLMRGDIVSGTVDESLDPYSPYIPGGTLANQLVQPRALAQNNKTKNYTVQNIKFLSGDTKDTSVAHRDILKSAIVKYGAVGCSMYWDGSSAVGGQSGDTGSYRATTGAFFYNGGATQNHAVTLVGWDDNYSMENFISTRRPTANGAWLVQNSWGTGWGIQPAELGERGYFWISYQDTQAPITAWVIDGVEPFDSNKKLYEVCFHGFESSLYYDGFSTVYGANYFTAGSNEAVEQVIFFIPQANTTVSIYIVPSYTGAGSLNINNIPAQNKVMNANSFMYPGWYTFNLPAEVPITGAQFAVVVEYKLSSGVAWVPSSVTMPQNRSFISPDGTNQWNAMSSRNVNIKAVTKPQADLTDEQAVTAAKNNLTWETIRGGNIVQNNVRTNLNLITSGFAGTTISWASSNTDVIAANGTVTRPEDENVNVTLTATISRGEKNDSTMFNLTVVDINDTDTGSDPAGSAVVPSLNAPGATINLTSETISLPSNFTVAAYSLDGGKKWRKGALPQGDRFGRLFNKETEIWLSDTWIDKAVREGREVVLAKGVPSFANKIQFPKINQRPRPDRLTVFYPQSNAGIYVIAERSDTGGTPLSTGYEWAGTSNGKTPNDGGWNNLSAGGFNMADVVPRMTVLVRSSAVASSEVNIPAGRTLRFRPRPFGKAPNYKVNTKKGIVALRANDAYSTDGSNFSVLSVKTDIPLSEIPSGVIYIMKSATGRKPASLIQTLTIPGASGG